MPAGTYFFGYVQNSATILNLGLDTNTPADASRKLINFNGTWTTSQLPGMWMIRPVFSSQPLNVGINELQRTYNIELYPVPAQELVNIKFDHPDVARMQMKITDITGRIVFQSANFEKQINVSSLAAGLYTLRLIDPVTGSAFSNKIIVAAR